MMMVGITGVMQAEAMMVWQAPGRSSPLQCGTTVCQKPHVLIHDQ
jgi:hypothetical protein